MFRSLKYYVSEISKQDGSAAGCDKWHSGDLAWNSVISNIKLWFERDKKTIFQINLTILKKAKVVSFFLFQILVKFVKDLRLTDFCAGVHIWRRRKARRSGSRWTWSTASTTTRMGRRRTRREDI